MNQRDLAGIASAAVAVALLGAVLSATAYLLLRAYGRRVRNFRGQEILSGYGLYIAAWAAASPIAVLLGARFGVAKPVAAALVVVVAAMGVLGFLDDAFGAHGSGGFGGHLRALVRQGRVTTGLLKAGGGGFAALVAAWMLNSGQVRSQPETVALVLMNAAIIALSANFINLLDLRPGRAGWSFLVLWAVLAVCVWPKETALHGVVMASGPHYLLLTLPAAAATAALLRCDSRGLWIMGDSGSNVLGAILGFGSALLMPLAGRVVVLALLVLVHIYAEWFSLSSAIERNRFLRTIDRRLGVR